MFERVNERKKKIVGIKLAAIVLLSMLVLSTISIPTEAHMPGADPPPEFELGSIII